MAVNKEKFEEIESKYQEMSTKGKNFIEEKLIKDWRLEKYIELKDEIIYYIFREFPGTYDKYFENPPQIPKLSGWYFVLSRVLWLPEKLSSKIWWPKFGTPITNYINYFNDNVGKALAEIEAKIH